MTGSYGAAPRVPDVAFQGIVMTGRWPGWQTDRNLGSEESVVSR